MARRWPNNGQMLARQWANNGPKTVGQVAWRSLLKLPWIHQDDMKALFTLLVICEEDPRVIGGFASQRASNTDLWRLFVIPERPLNKQTICRWFETPVWRHSIANPEPYQAVECLQLSWRAGTRGFHRLEPDLQMNYLRWVLSGWDISKSFTKCVISGLILHLRPANERRRYFVTTSLIGWAQA